MAEGTGLEPASDKCAVVFKTTALPVRLPFRTFLLADWRLPIDCSKQRERPIENDLVPVVGLAPTKSLRTPDLQSGAFAAQPHMRNAIQISSLYSRDFKSEIHLC